MISGNQLKYICKVPTEHRVYERELGVYGPSKIVRRPRRSGEIWCLVGQDSLRVERA